MRSILPRMIRITANTMNTTPTIHFQERSAGRLTLDIVVSLQSRDAWSWLHRQNREALRGSINLVLESLREPSSLVQKRVDPIAAGTAHEEHVAKLRSRTKWTCPRDLVATRREWVERIAE